MPQDSRLCPPSLCVRPLTNWWIRWPGNGKEAGQQTHCVAWMPIASYGRQRTGDRLSLGIDSKQLRAHRRRQTVATVILLRKLSSHTVHATISILTSRAFWEIFCAGQTGFVCEVLQAPNAQSCRFEKSPNIPVSGRPTARRPLPALEPVSEFCWKPLGSQQHNQTERRNDEFDADVLSFQPQFLLQELIFAHCPFRTSLADPFVEISSPNPIGSLSGESQTPSASSCRSRSWPTADRELEATESSL